MNRWTVEPVRPPVVHHYSEDPTIECFVPHVPGTNPGSVPLVWAIEPAYAPLYWFPRDCARVTVWAHDDAQRAVLRDRWATTAGRVHFAARADEAWVRSTRVFDYTFAPEPFEPWPDAEGQWVAAAPVRARAVVPIDDLVEAHAVAGVDLRFDDDLAGRRDEVLASGLPFSIVRWSRRG
jgi:hypothetical protein